MRSTGGERRVDVVYRRVDGDFWAELSDASTRRAFLRTLRSVVDVRGPCVTNADRLYLAAASLLAPAALTAV